MIVEIVVAMDESRGIGREGRLPWHYPEDLVRFKRYTMDGVLVVGRKTWESIPGCLPGRLPFVITRNPDYNTKAGALISHNLETVIKVTRAGGMFTHLYIAGGAEIYQEALDKGLVDRITVTTIPGTHDCDTFFPELPSGFSKWFSITHRDGTRTDTYVK